MRLHNTTWKVLVCLLLFPLLSSAQNHWEAGFAIGYANYHGDLVEPVFTLKEPHPAGQLFFRKQFDANHTIRFNFLYSKISGKDSNFEGLSTRGNSFETPISELSIIGEIDPFGKRRYPKKRLYSRATTPYLMVGLGVLLAEPKVTYGDPENIDTSVDYPKWHVAVPVGLGVKIDIIENIYLGAEFATRVTVTDNLDGVQLSGNANRNDSYLFGGISFGYRLGKKSEVLPKEKKEKKKRNGEEVKD